ncbi:TolC family outer membrane protein [Oceanimonas sp. NS1]|uniref:Channel protein TolC n=1 Tax=Oceanimonas doudoroffii TaxID=84158 RepID=A0A233RET2_9GAMM|nr:MULTISPECIES: TolC family outer membrane protein [Oceanimonas]MCT7655684.1 TolC family outer membrane protein [Oceanimonas sp. NS1]NHI01408.1 Outer membrane efflux protein BepC [Oceanimonas sp. MB9]OXY81892.1 channel protein TolC [Oceanimonas doudoroffii]
MRKSAIAVLVGAAMVLPAHGQTLEEAVTQTLLTHPKVKESFHLYQSRQYEHDEAFAGYLPTLDANAGIGYEYTDSPGVRDGDARTDKTLTRKEAGLSLRQMLFDGFKTPSNVHRTQAEADAQRYALLSDAENIALRVAEVYLDVLRQDEIVELSRRNLSTHEQILSDIQRRTSSGVGSTADLNQINGRVARAYSNMTAAENNLRDAQSQFVSLVNEMPGDLRQPQPDANYVPPTLEDALAQAKDNHPTLMSASFDVEAAHQQHRDAKSGFYPTVNIELDSNWNDDIDGVRGHNNDFTAMVRMRYNLFNGGADLARSRSTSALEMQAKDIHMNAHRQVEEGMRLAWAAYESLGRQKDFLQRHVESSYDTVDAYKKQFSLGSRTLLDVLNTENELFEARRSYINAEYDQLLAEYRIMNASGRLLEALRFTQPEQWQESE